MLKILLVEDNVDYATLVKIALKKAIGVQFCVTHAPILSQALKLISVESFDAILLDLSLPDSHGIDTVIKTRAANQDVPIIILSGMLDEEQVLDAVKCGAQDYLIKGQGDNYLLPRTIRYAIERQKAKRALNYKNDELDRKVKLRTAELAKVNDELKKEIIERKTIQDKLQESEENLQTIFEQVAIGVAVIEACSGKFIKINLKYCDIVGYTNEEMLSLDFMKITNPVDLNSSLHNMSRILNGEVKEYQEEIRYIKKDGSQVWVNLTASLLRNTSEQLPSYIVVVEDISQRKKIEKALRESEQQIRLITDNLPVLIAYVDSELFFRFNNKAYENWYNLKTDEIVGRHKSVIVGNMVFNQMLPYIKTALSGKAVNFETILPYKDNSVRYINVSFVPDKDDQGIIKGFFSLTEDISERKWAQAQEKQLILELAHGERLSDVGKMATEIAHELNQPLAAIANYGKACINFMKSGQAAQEDLLQGLQSIVSQAIRSADIIRNIRNFVHKTDCQRMPSDINNLIYIASGLVSSEARRNQVNIRLELADDLPLVMVNKILIEQVILNLMRNAIEAMNEIKDTRHQRELSVQTILNENGKPEIIIQDTGPGLTENNLDKVFNTFFTTKEDGLGVGLSICRSIIEDHNEKIWAKPNYGNGGDFRFTLPVETEICKSTELNSA